jgi:hypothetical protein
VQKETLAPIEAENRKRMVVQVDEDDLIVFLPGTDYIATFYRATPGELLAKSHAGHEVGDAPMTFADEPCNTSSHYYLAAAVCRGRLVRSGTLVLTARVFSLWCGASGARVHTHRCHRQPYQRIRVSDPLRCESRCKRASPS